MNVLVHTFMGGSHYKNQREMANWLTTLQREDGGHKFNVTVFVYQDNVDFTESENMHIIRHREKGQNFLDMKEHSNQTDLGEVLKHMEAKVHAVMSLLGKDYDIL